MATFEIKWNQTLFVVDLTPQEYNVMTVKDLKLRCQTLAQLKPDYYKLLAHGALLKEDDKLIKEYKIATGSKVILMGCKRHVLSLEPMPKEDAPIRIRLIWIRNRRNRYIKPDLERHEQEVKEFLSSATKKSNMDQLKKLIQYNGYLHEQLMDIMAQLDTMANANEDEKVHRKQNVKETEYLLDQSDQIRSHLLKLL